MKEPQTKPKSLSSLSIFFPAYNEEGNIQKSIEQAYLVAQNITDNFEVIVVNDGSTDKTAKVVTNLQDKYPNVILHNHKQNQGYGGAVWSGFNTATKDWIFFSDADLQFDLAELSLLVEHTNKHSVIVGYRHNRQDPFLRSANAWGWKILNRIVFGLKETQDIDCAFKLIKSEAIKPLLPQIISRGAMISAEFLIRLKKAGYVIKEVPVTHYPRTAGSSTGANIKVILRAFSEMVSLIGKI